MSPTIGNWEFVGAIAEVGTVVCFLFHLVFDQRLRRQIRSLTVQQRELIRALAILQSQESWVPSNSAFSHAPWVLVAISVPYYRVASRSYKREDIQFWHQLFGSEAVRSHPHLVYRCCRDPFGIFGDIGSYGRLDTLSDAGCRLLKLAYPVSFEPQEPQPEASAQAETPLPVVYPEVVSESSVS